MVICTSVTSLLAIVSIVFLNMAPSVNSLETSGGETTEVRKDGSLGKDSQTGPVSGSSLLYPQVPNFGFAHVLLFSGKTKPPPCGLPHKTSGLSLHLFS